MPTFCVSSEQPKATWHLPENPGSGSRLPPAMVWYMQGGGSAREPESPSPGAAQGHAPPGCRGPGWKEAPWDFLRAHALSPTQVGLCVPSATY